MAGHDNVIKLLVEQYGKVPVSMVTVLVCFEDDCSVCSCDWWFQSGVQVIPPHSMFTHEEQVHTGKEDASYKL